MIYPKLVGGASLLISLSLQRKTTLIVGTGRLAAVRASAALQADSRVVVVSSELSDRDAQDEEIVARRERGELELVELSEGDNLEEQTLEKLLDSLATVNVAFITDTLIGSEKRRGYQSAAALREVLRRRNILVNVTDQPSLCDFTLPACHRFSSSISSSSPLKSPSSLQIAVTTNGRGCRLAGRIRREIVARLPSNIGDAVENVSRLRQRVKEMSALPTSEVVESEDSLSSTPNEPVPQRAHIHTYHAIVQEESPEEAQKRQMKWVAQISEFWPLERLASVNEREREEILQESHQQLLTSRTLLSCADTSLRQDSHFHSRHNLKLVSREFVPSRGKIYLLGSGLGHPGLLTLATHDILTKRATLVLSDKLVPSEVLALIPPTTTVKIAKKFPGNADGAQNEMMLEAIEAARRGEIVVRLKQGDPMVYGRAGEEILFFRQHGYEAVVIPGLSSAIAGPAFAGIPVTQRGVSESLVLCTGVGRGGRGTRLPGYQRERTLVLLMGVARLDDLVEALMNDDTLPGEGGDEKGRRREGAPYPRNLPIAIIERASMPDQRVISGTLDTIMAAMKSTEVGEQRPPGMIVVGWCVLALGAQGDISVLDDVSNTPSSELADKDDRRVRRWLGDRSWLVKEGFARWE